MEAFFRVVNITGAEALDEGGIDQAPEVDEVGQEEVDEVGQDAPENGSDPEEGQAPVPSLPNPEGDGLEGASIFDLLNRIREDLTKSKVIDVVMQPSGTKNLDVVISLGLESLLSEGALETLLSGKFTVLGKVTRVLKQDEVINLHQRTVFSFLDGSVLDEVFQNLEDNPAFNLSKSPSSVKAPAIQVLPLAIYV